MKKFIPVRILEKEWAERFLSGEIFMRKNANFGTWNRLLMNDDKEINNNYRGDLREGIIENIANPKENELLKRFDPDLVNVVQNAYLIDYGGTQLFNLLCFTCLEYDEEQRLFEQPHQNLKLFGDTVIVFVKMNAFLRRLLQVMVDKRICFLMDRIQYYSKQRSMKMPNPLFFKDDSYAWENELRIAVGHLDVNNRYKRNNDERWPLKDIGDLILEIGDISDIVKIVDIEDFISGKFLNNLEIEFPMSEKNNTIFDKVLTDTKKDLDGFQSMQARLSITIW